MEGVPLLFAASLVYVIAASIQCTHHTCTGSRGYAIVVGVVSLFITTLLIVIRAIKQAAMVDKMHKFISLFLFVWWGVGAAVGTFNGPFTDVGNGYFAAWAAFLFSTQYAYSASQIVRNMLDRGANAAMGGGAAPNNTAAPGDVQVDQSSSV
ncbi:hypothetical protein JKP88DRAFT_236875 [Tribonema minus]|uniref:MARVEL domain-containing protein n=1 Tax=Tribonema minus TaxID=303371 RepID=A0A835ZAN8_9STRA|nr:hypothetical protein JKP88DRAFT_236875 [Tribonema minus]